MDEASTPRDGELTRLERAMRVWVEHQQRGGAFDEVRNQHPDLVELLDLLVADDELRATDDTDDRETIGPFRLLGEIGRGGMGVVYEAEHRALGRRLALKLLTDETLTDPRKLARFVREAKILARLDHPGIVRVLDVGESSGRHWIAMELIDGETLDAHLRRLRDGGGHRGDSLNKVVAAIAEVAAALAHAHAAGVVHRDLKPSNVFLRGDGRAVLGDFGVARDAGVPSLTMTGALVGTPHYLAPEVLRGGSPGDPASDVFSLGAVLYEAITLQRPFDGESLPEIVDSILLRDPPDPRRLVPIPSDLAAIAMKALEKSPSRRYLDAPLFAADLRAFLEFRPVSARTVGATTRAWRSLRREPLRLGVLAAVMIALTLGGALMAALPGIRDGQRVAEENAYAQHLARGAMARVRRDSAMALTEFGSAAALRPERVEPLFLICTELQRQHGGDAGLREFHRRTAADAPADDDVQWVRLLLLQRAGEVEGAATLRSQLGVPSSSLALWVQAVSLMETVRSPGPAGAEVCALLRRAVHRGGSPNYLLWLQWVGAASLEVDANVQRETVEAAIAQWPHDGAMLHYAAAVAQRYDPKVAIELQRRAVAAAGFDDPYLHSNLAGYEFIVGERAAAMQRMRSVLERAPLSSELRDKYAQMCQENGELEQGLRAVDEWLAAIPDDPIALRRRGGLLAERGDMDLARESFRRVVELSPDDEHAHADYALALDLSGDLEGAIAANRAILERHPNDVVAHTRLCGELMELGRFEAAALELERWLASHAGDTQALVRLAGIRVHAALGTPAEIVAAAERAVWATQGSDAVVMQVLSDAWRICGDAAQAERYAAIAAELEARTPK